MPRPHRGERVSCLYRDGEAVVTGWHDGRIPWPRVRALGSHGGTVTPHLPPGQSRGGTGRAGSFSRRQASTE